MTKPILIIGYGNPSRGDDALGCLVLDFIEQHADLTHIECITDFQLQIEHALDLKDRALVLFADAEVNTQQAFTLTELSAIKDNSFSSHAISPAAVLAVYENITGQSPPPCFLLSIQASSFELGEDLSDSAKANLAQANNFVLQLLNHATPDDWRQIILSRGMIKLPEKVVQNRIKTDFSTEQSQVQQ